MTINPADLENGSPAEKLAGAVLFAIYDDVRLETCRNPDDLDRFGSLREIARGEPFGDKTLEAVDAVADPAAAEREARQLVERTLREDAELLQRFRSTRQWLDGLADGVAGWFYLGTAEAARQTGDAFDQGIMIQKMDRSAHGHDWLLTIANQEWASDDLETLEFRLFRWARAEGLI